MNVKHWVVEGVRLEADTGMKAILPFPSISSQLLLRFMSFAFQAFGEKRFRLSLCCTFFKFIFIRTKDGNQAASCIITWMIWVNLCSVAQGCFYYYFPFHLLRRKREGHSYTF